MAMLNNQRVRASNTPSCAKYQQLAWESSQPFEVLYASYTTLIQRVSKRSVSLKDIYIYHYIYISHYLVVSCSNVVSSSRIFAIFMNLHDCSSGTFTHWPLDLWQPPPTGDRHWPPWPSRPFAVAHAVVVPIPDRPISGRFNKGHTARTVFYPART